MAKLRSENRATLLVDAGNALIGADSIASGGEVVVAAYNALGYDVLNLACRDLRLGKRRTLAALDEANFEVVSASLVDEATGLLLVKPYVVKKAGGLRVAFVGVTELPVGAETLVHLRTQLAGIRVRPAPDALAEWIPRARAESDRVILLYYGSAAGLDVVRRRFGRDLAAILVGGLRPVDLPDRSTPPLMATGEHGTQIARLRWAPGGRVEITQLDVDASYPRDGRMESLLKPYLMPH